MWIEKPSKMAAPVWVVPKEAIECLHALLGWRFEYVPFLFWSRWLLLMLYLWFLMLLFCLCRRCCVETSVCTVVAETNEIRVGMTMLMMVDRWNRRDDNTVLNHLGVRSVAHCKYSVVIYRPHLVRPRALLRRQQSLLQHNSVKVLIHNPPIALLPWHDVTEFGTALLKFMVVKVVQWQ